MIAITSAASHVAAQETQGAVTEVIVTGTRSTGLRAVDSPAPVQVLGSSALQRVGQPDLVQSLAQNVPSFTAQALGGDTANLTLSARLRGLSPNDTLVLIDGKRRHGTANLAVLGGPYQGGAAPDLNFIPVDAIDHVEVLTDGAAAQYGTDAIAGVINIILKKNKTGGNVIVSGGRYFDEGGETGDATANVGLAPLGDNSWFNFTVESRFHGHSNRGNIDPRVYNHDGRVNIGPSGPNNAITQLPGYPYVNQISGDALYHLNVAEFDAGYDFGSGWEFYSFGTYGHKNGQAFENTRMPTVAPSIWPIGFNPQEELLEDDFAATIGLKGSVLGFSVDLSSTYGKDKDIFHTEGSANPALIAASGSTQTDFYDGQLLASQWTNNLDFTRDFELGLSKPLTLAFGVEQRHDTYQIIPGEPSSYENGGAQSYPGFSSIVATRAARDNVGVYADLALSPIESLQLDGAVRWEHYSDFGDTTVYKVTARYDFSPAFALRGTISDGFRAPTLAEEHYSSVNVGPTTAFGQFPPDSPGAASLGFGGLKPETSHNYSIGFVTHPGPVTATLDGYYIEIKNRIVGSGNIYGSSNIPGQAVAPAVDLALAGSGYTFPPSVLNTGINIFANGLDTRTVGLEGVVTFASNFGDMGHVDWSVTGAYNDTKVTHIDASPAAIAPQVLYDATAISILETASPKFRLIGDAVWTLGRITVNLRETLYGKSSEQTLGDDGVLYDTTIGTTGITDLEVSYKTDFGVRVTLGANNLFNQYPEQFNAALVRSFVAANDNAAVARYPDWSPFGINGGYYYGKLTYTF